jgi:hypothetical protein
LLRSQRIRGRNERNSSVRAARDVVTRSLPRLVVHTALRTLQAVVRYRDRSGTWRLQRMVCGDNVRAERTFLTDSASANTASIPTLTSGMS